METPRLGGIALGNSDPAGDQTTTATAWLNGLQAPLGTLGGFDGHAARVNARARSLAGPKRRCKTAAAARHRFCNSQAARYAPDGSTHILPPLQGDPDCAATAVNNANGAVGISGTCDNSVGAYSARPCIAALGMRAHKIPPLPCDQFDAGDSLNDHGLLVGQPFGGAQGSRAFMWQDGQAADMNALVAGGDPLYLVYATDLNDAGEIVGQACVISNGACTGSMVAFLAIPTRATACPAMAGIRVPMALALSSLHRRGDKHTSNPQETLVLFLFSRQHWKWRQSRPSCQER